MPTPVYRTAFFLSQLVQRLPIGTNLAIAHLLFTVLAGHLLQSRGALFPALAATGLTDSQVRGAEAAMREGKWSLTYLLKRLNWLLEKEGKAITHQINLWQPMPLDWVAFFRPRLAGCFTKHFDSQAQKALPAVELGMVATLKKVGERLIPCLISTTRSGDTLTLLQAAKKMQGPKDVILADSQVKISHLHRAGISRFIVRGATNSTFRRSKPCEAGPRGPKPKRGEQVRPLTRTFNGKVIPGNPPDRIETFKVGKRTLIGHWFDSVVIPASKGDAACLLVFSCLVILDPKYKKPWVLLTDLGVGAPGSVSAETIYLLYRCRWKIESLPQTAKQILGGHQSFVHAESSRFRLPELCLLAASIAQYLSATSPVVATGFWDRAPQATAGRFRRCLSGAPMPNFSEFAAFCPRVRKKASVHEHLPKGVLGHRRQKRQEPTPSVTGN